MDEIESFIGLWLILLIWLVVIVGDFLGVWDLLLSFFGVVNYEILVFIVRILCMLIECCDVVVWL